MRAINISILTFALIGSVASADIIGKQLVINPQVDVDQFIDTTSPTVGFYANKNTCWWQGKLVDPVANLQNCDLGDMSSGCELTVFNNTRVSFPAGALKGEIVNFLPASGTDPWGKGYSWAELELQDQGDLQVKVRCYRAKGSTTPLYYPEMAKMMKGLAEVQ